MIQSCTCKGGGSRRQLSASQDQPYLQRTYRRIRKVKALTRRNRSYPRLRTLTPRSPAWGRVSWWTSGRCGRTPERRPGRSSWLFRPSGGQCCRRSGPRCRRPASGPGLTAPRWLRVKTPGYHCISDRLLPPHSVCVTARLAIVLQV